VDRLRVGIIIPALNEGATIGPIVRRASAFGRPIVVNDGSTDTTATAALAEGAEVVSHDGNRGYDAALQSGFECADRLNLEWAITIDADGQHDPTILQAFCAALDDGAELVVGIRSRRQRFSEHLFAWIGTRRWGIRDPLCGMKGYRMTVYRACGHFDSYQSIGTELALFAARSGARVVQLPIAVRERAGTPRFGRRFAANYKIVRALWIALRRDGRRRETSLRRSTTSRT
jgi:glycosyltransferase involved in cell wall biosynthesis